MKVTIEFDNTDDRDAIHDAIDALRVYEYRNALDSIMNEVRRMWKYEEHGEEAGVMIDRLRAFISEEIGCLLDD